MPMISSSRGFTAYTRIRSLALSAAARNRPPYCRRGVAPITAIECGLSILCIDAIWLSVQISMSTSSKYLELIELGGVPPQHFGAFILRYTLKTLGDTVAGRGPC